MTITETIDGIGYEYCGVLIKVENSPIYRLKAPDNTTVAVYDYRPGSGELREELRRAGYTASAKSKLPFRDLEIPAETLPRNLTKP